MTFVPIGATRFRLAPSACIRRVALAMLVILAAGAADAEVAEAPVRIGVLAFLGGEAATAEWSPVVERLAEALPGRRVELLQFDHLGLAASAAAGSIDFVITNPGHYVELEVAIGASRILTLDAAPTRSAARALGSAVIAPSTRSDLRTLEDLRGKRVAIVGREGFGGYQTVQRELAPLGIDPERDFAALTVVGLPMSRVFDVVASGEVDAGIVRACLVEEQPDGLERFKVVGARDEPDFACATSTRLYPDWPIATLRDTPPALAKEVAIALLGMSREERGMAWAVPADYQAVHEMFRELRLGPYATLHEPTLMMLAERYWPWVAALALLLGAWIIYTVRVEHLVHARTAALRAALDAREALEARMRAGQEQADHMARLSVLGELAGTLAHELNQPLAAIGNYAQSLRRRVDNARLTDDAVREASGEIAAQAERAAGILGRIRGFAKKRASVREKVAPREVVAEAIPLFCGMLANAPDVELSDTLPAEATVEVDPLQIQQVILNLLKNGYDAARGLPASRQGLAVTITASGDDNVHIVVRDFGVGLDDGARDRLFEPFFTTKPDGLGLGLSICRTIAEAHRGRLAATAPVDGPGSEFVLTLPLAAAPPIPATTASAHVPHG